MEILKEFQTQESLEFTQNGTELKFCGWKHLIDERMARLEVYSNSVQQWSECTNLQVEEQQHHKTMLCFTFVSQEAVVGQGISKTGQTGTT